MNKRTDPTHQKLRLMHRRAQRAEGIISRMTALIDLAERALINTENTGWIKHWAIRDLRAIRRASRAQSGDSWSLLYRSWYTENEKLRRENESLKKRISDLEGQSDN
jgi:cell division protein FtsB